MVKVEARCSTVTVDFRSRGNDKRICCDFMERTFRWTPACAIIRRSCRPLQSCRGLRRCRDPTASSHNAVGFPGPKWRGTWKGAARKKLRKRTVKPLKSLGRVNLCAAWAMLGVGFALQAVRAIAHREGRTPSVAQFLGLAPGAARGL